MKLTTISFVFCFTVTSFLTINAQFTGDYKFPVNTIYNYGKVPANKNHSDALAAYNAWKTTYVESSTCVSGGYRVKFDSPNDNQTVSEGIGYGMLLSAYAGDKPLFDGLWKYYKAFLNSNGIMHWKVNTSCGIVNQNGATDAELDVTMALYVACWQWGLGSGQYLTDCKAMIQKIKLHEVEQSTNVLKPGDQFGGTDLTNPSYFSPAYYRLFGKITNDATYWNAVATKGYAVINAAKNATTGLVPDWCKADGSSAPLASQYGYHAGGNNFFFDAIRTPFRTGIDYLWYGTPEAKTFCEKVTDFVKNTVGGSQNLGSEYSLAGNKLDNSHSNAFVGCFAVAAMATDRVDPSYQIHLNTSYTDDINTNPGSGQYFNATLKAITLFVMTGNFYLPPPDQCDAPDLGPDKSLCSASSILLNSMLPTSTNGVTRTFEWKKNGVTISGATAPTYTATSAGVYEVIARLGSCVRKDLIEVFTVNVTPNFTFINTAGQVAFTDASAGGPASWSWNFGDASPLDITQNPIHNYSAAGLYNVVLTVKNICGTTYTVTNQVTIGAPGGVAGWVQGDFTTSNYLNVWVYHDDTKYPPASGGITLDQTSCKEVIIKVPATVKQFEYVSIAFKKASNPFLLDLSKYPYVRMRIKIDKAIDSLRVDLQNGTPNYGATSKSPLYIKGPKNTSGGYDKIPANVYFVTTLDFTGKFITYPNTAMDPTKIEQLSFMPAAQFNPPAVPVAYNLTVDWVIAGYENLPKPVSKIADKMICLGGSVIINADNCAAESYVWSTGETTASITATTIGTYIVKLTNFGGTTIDTILVTQADPISAGFVSSAIGNVVSFTDGSTGATTYAWDFGDPASTTANTSALKNPSHTFSTPATYSVCLTVTGPCGTQKSCQPVTTTSVGISEAQQGFLFHAFPNPFTDQVTLLVNAATTESIQIKITDIQGKKVQAVETTTNTAIVLGENFSRGLYIIQVISEKNTSVYKINKQ